MKQTLTQQLDKKISQAQKLNRKLTQILQKQQKMVQQHHDSQNKDIILRKQQQKQLKKQQKRQTQQKILINLTQRIKIYQTELEKSSNITAEHYFQQISKLETQIEQLDTKSNKMDQEIRFLQEELNKKERKFHQEEEFNQYFNKVQNLKKKLSGYLQPVGQGQGIESQQKLSLQQSLQNGKNSTIRRKKARSISHLVQPQQNSITVKTIDRNQDKSSNKISDNKNEDPSNNKTSNSKKRKIDKEALYRNLIKYYQANQTKLKEQIQQLEKKKISENAEREKVENQIKQYEQKIQKAKEKTGAAVVKV